VLVLFRFVTGKTAQFGKVPHYFYRLAAVDDSALTDSQPNRIVQQLMEPIRLPGQWFTSHSGRCRRASASSSTAASPWRTLARC
jgi:hypothetical protein